MSEVSAADPHIAVALSDGGHRAVEKAFDRSLWPIPRLAEMEALTR